MPTEPHGRLEPGAAMSRRAVERLLRKQRLQLRAAEQRRGWVGMLDELDALGARAAAWRGGWLNAGARLLRSKGSLLAGATALLLWRRQPALRWLQRGWLIYLGAKRLAASLRRLFGAGARP
jgi:hypothetical protein